MQQSRVSKQQSAGAASRRRDGIPAPSGATAPTEPSAIVDPVLQEAMERVEPASGVILARLVGPDDRPSAGLPASAAHQASALLELLACHPEDDTLARDVPPGSLIFASLEGLAPLLESTAYLVPAERIQGTLPRPGETRPAAPALGFEA